MRKSCLFWVYWVLLLNAAGAERPSERLRRWSFVVSGGLNGTKAMSDGILLHKADSTGNLLLGSKDSFLFEFAAGYELYPGISATGVCSAAALDAGTDTLGITLPDAPSSIQIATGRMVEYGGEVRFDWGLLTGASHYFFDPHSDRKSRGYLGVGFGRIRSTRLQTSSEGKRYIGVSGVESGGESVIRLGIGFDYKLGRRGWVAQGNVGFTKRLAGELLTVNTEPSSEFESGELLIGPVQFLVGLGYHF